MYDDQDHPNRVTGTIHSPPYVEDDHALLMGLDAYERSLCPGCGEPKAHAWHAELEGWYEADEFVCHGCTARNGGKREAVYTLVRNTYPFDAKAPLQPLAIGVTTTPPTPHPHQG